MFIYSFPALVVFFITYDALLKDDTTPNNSVDAWVLMGVAALIWPVTLPCILRKKAMNWRTAAKTNTRLA